MFAFDKFETWKYSFDSMNTNLYMLLSCSTGKTRGDKNKHHGSFLAAFANGDQNMSDRLLLFLAEVTHPVM